MLRSPDSPMTKMYAEIVGKLREPEPSVTAERFHFHKRNQYAGGSL